MRTHTSGAALPDAQSTYRRLPPAVPQPAPLLASSPHLPHITNKATAAGSSTPTPYPQTDPRAHPPPAHRCREA